MQLEPGREHFIDLKVRVVTKLLRLNRTHNNVYIYYESVKDIVTVGSEKTVVNPRFGSHAESESSGLPL